MKHKSFSIVESTDSQIEVNVKGFCSRNVESCSITLNEGEVFLVKAEIKKGSIRLKLLRDVEPEDSVEEDLPDKRSNQLNYKKSLIKDEEEPGEFDETFDRDGVHEFKIAAGRYIGAVIYGERETEGSLLVVTEHKQ